MNSDPVKGERFTFRLRDLLLVVICFAILGGWVADRARMTAQLAEMKESVRTIEFKQGYLKEHLFERTIGAVGQPLARFPEVRILADAVMSEKSEHFDYFFDYAVERKMHPRFDDCRVYFFEWHGGNREGDFSDFYLITSGDVIVHVQCGEVLNS